MTAFIFNAAARSRMAISSAFCWSVVRPGLDGQQELPTVAIHAARNSRSGGGGTIFSGDVFSSAATNRAIGQIKAAIQKSFFQFMPFANETQIKPFWQRISNKNCEA